MRLAADNDRLEIPIHSACQRARCASGGKQRDSALRVSNQRQIKTAHGLVIKVSMRTCETPSLPAEHKYKLLELRRRHPERADETSHVVNVFSTDKTIMSREVMEKIKPAMRIIYHKGNSGVRFCDSEIH